MAGSRLCLSLWVAVWVGLSPWTGCRGSEDADRQVKALLSHKLPSFYASPDPGLRSLEFCHSCPDPHLEGTQVLGLGAAQGPMEYHVAGNVAYAVPNQMQQGALLNSVELVGRIALVDRGDIPLVEKILLAQEAGAIGVIIADDGNCEGDGFQCGRVGSVKDGGFSKMDPQQAWRKVKIPAILVKLDVGDRLRKMLAIEQAEIPGFGNQWVKKRPPRRGGAGPGRGWPRPAWEFN